MKKQTLYAFFGVIAVTLACTFGTATPPAPTQVPDDPVGTVVAATMQALLTSTAAPGGAAMACGNVSLVLPGGLASGVNAQAVAAVDETGGAPWEVAPAHVKCTLTGYPLQGKFFEPTIFVYPAGEFAQANQNAAEQIDRLKKALAGSPLLKETLPMVPFFGAASIIAANIQIISFQNGKGVRELTQYDQYAAPVNNHELFYHFQGLTSDNKYYVIAVLPITAPILAENETPAAPIPAGGVPLPTDVGPGDVYYSSVTQKLNALAPEAYAPSLNTLDTLIQSILVTTP